MNKILTKVTALCVGLAMVAGVGVVVGSKSVGEAKAAAPYDFSGDTVTFSNQSLENSKQYSGEFTNSSTFKVQFTGGTNDGKYYTTGSGIRTYGGGSIVITALTGNLTSIVFTWDGSNAPAADNATPSGYSTSTKTWTGSAASVTLTRPSGSGHWRCKAIQATTSGGSETSHSVKDSVSNGTITPSSVEDGQTLTATIAPETWYSVPTSVSVTMGGTVVTHTYSNGVVTVQNVTGDIEISGSCVKTGGPAHAGTLADPYTIADAYMAIDDNAGKDNVYVQGIVSGIVESWSTQYNNISFNISSDGTTTSNQLEVFRCVSSTEHPISSDSDIETGATVVVFGSLTKYNSTYEFGAGCKVVAYTAPTSSPLSSISLSGTHATSFDVGDTFSYAGLVVTAHYEDSTSKEVTPTSVSTPDMTTAGQKTVTVSYTENEVTKSETYSITVNAVTLYTMSFDPGSGTGTMESVQVKEGADYTLPACTFTAPAGMTFDAWTYIGTRMTQVTDVHSDYEFTAIWKDAPKVDTVTYDFSSEIPSEWVASLDKTTTDTSLGRGVGWGAAKGTITLTIDNDKMVTSVVVTASTNNAGNTVAVSVGGNAYGDAKEIASGTDHKNQEYTFDGSSSGDIIVTLEDTAKTVWVLSIAVTAESSGSKVLESISVTDPKTAYEVGDEFVKPTTTAHYDDETTGNITNKATFTGYDMNVAGEYTVNVSYTEGEVEKTTSYGIVVSEPAPVVVANYKKVKTNLADYSGNYLIVCESKNVAFDGSLATLDAVGNNQSVSISEEVINASSAYEFTIAAKTDGYSVRSASKKYIGSTTTSNELKTSDSDDYTNEISYSAGVSEIACNDHYLRYNDASNQNRFRYFTNQNQKAISLFVKVANDAEAFALDILNLTTEVCSAEGEHAAGDFATAWSTLTTKYDSVVNKDLLVGGDADATGTFFAEALARYDILVAKYGLNPFMTGRVSNFSYLPHYESNLDSSSSITIIVIVAVTSMTLLGVTLVLRKRKHQ